jgi:hypothetical protein
MPSARHSSREEGPRSVPNREPSIQEALYPTGASDRTLVPRGMRDSGKETVSQAGVDENGLGGACPSLRQLQTIEDLLGNRN